MLSCIIAGFEGDSIPMFCLCSFALLPIEKPSSFFSLRSDAHRRARIGLASILLLFAGFLLTGRVAAQRIPDVPPPTCVDVPGIPCGRSGSSGDSGERSDPFGAWKARWDAGAGARKQHKAARDAQKLARQKAKDAARWQAIY